MEILPRISDMILNYSTSFEVELSAFELHLETVVDLSTPEGKEGQDRTCTVRQDALARYVLTHTRSLSKTFKMQRN